MREFPRARRLLMPLRIAFRLAPGLLLLLAAVAHHAAAQERLDPRVVDCIALRGSRFPNMLRPTSAVYDQWRGILYVVSREYPHIAVIGTEGAQTGVIPLPDDLRGRVALLDVIPSNGRILATTDDVRTSSVVSVIDPLGGTRVGRYDAGACTTLRCAQNTARGVAYLATGRRHVLVMDAATFTPVDSLDSGGRPATDVAIDTVHEELAVALTDIFPLFTVFSTRFHQFLRTLTIPLPGVADRIAVDPASQRVFLIGPTSVRLVDEFGASAYEVAIPGRTRAVAASPRSHRLYLLDSTGYGASERREGKLFSFSFLGPEYDSTRAGLDCRVLAVDRPNNRLALVATGASTIEFRDIYSTLPVGSCATGHSVDDLALPAGRQSLYVANAYGSARDISRIDPGLGTLQRIALGRRPARFAPDPRRDRILVEHQFGSALSAVELEGGIVADSIPIAVGGTGGATDVFPSMVTDGRDRVLLVHPEDESFIVVDLAARRVERFDRIAGYTFNPADGARPLDAAFLPAPDSFAILDVARRMLRVYSAAPATPPFTVDLTALDWGRMPPDAPHLLRAAGGFLAIGPYLLSAHAPHGVVGELPGTSVLVGRDRAGRLVAVEWRGIDRLVRVYRDTSRAVWEMRLLARAPAVFSVLDLDEEGATILAGDTREGRALLYDITGLLAAETPPAAVDGIAVFPNPVTAGAGARITAVVSGPPAGGAFTVTLTNVLGAQCMQTRMSRTASARGAIAIDVPDVRPGVYVLRLTDGSRTLVAPVVIVR